MSLLAPIFRQTSQPRLTTRITSLLISSFQTSIRGYKLKSNSSYKLRFRKSKSSNSDFIKRGYTMHGHKRTGETHCQHLRRAGDAPLSKGFAKLIMKKLAPRL